MNADRNLILGILALQMDFINREALIAAMNVWILRKSAPLGQILLDQGVIRADVRAILESMVEKHLQQQDDEHRKMSPADSELGDAPDTKPPSSGQPNANHGRFRILRPHARGGLGEVYIAHDEELRREVALKQIREQRAHNVESRTRFLLEAEITGGLEHPGVVPVYSLGKYPDGRPFYAMRFIKGDSLMEAIEAFHRKQGTGDREQGRRAGGVSPPVVPGDARGAERLRVPHSAAFSSIEFRQLLGRFIDVCNAVEYAHCRGVLHRDLKPQNIMLGRYGETLVVDWGLAKALGRVEARPAGDELTLWPASAGGSTPTEMGRTIGTPQYMSPEQAAGKLDDLGPASDVYSLGATLYTLLAGREAIERGDVENMLDRVKTGRFPTPRQLNHKLPAALEAICLKAMALAPADRYPSARALADDLEHWLADEPVTAYREPKRARLERWGRRHKALVSGAVALAVTAVAALATIAILIHYDRELIREEHELTKFEQKALADSLAQAQADRAGSQRELAEALHARDEFRKRLEARESGPTATPE